MRKPLEPLKKFSTHFLHVLRRACEHAAEAKRDDVLPDDLFTALWEEEGSLGRGILTAHVKRPTTTVKTSTEEKKDVSPLTLSEKSSRVLMIAVRNAERHRHRYIGTEHLLYALLMVAPEAGGSSFAKQTMQIGKLKRDLTLLMNSASRFSDIALEQGEYHHHIHDHECEEEGGNTHAHEITIDDFGNDLTHDAREGRLDPVVGRDREIDRLITVLARRTKNNPLLLGDAGVGKTAIVEGLATRIARGDVPDLLIGMRVIALDVGSLVAGTMWRGDFEQRMEQLLDAAEDPQCILFIDELHMIVGAGGSNNSMDLANFLKPALARGKIRCIGATTPQEYKRVIESDRALARRFEPIVVASPDADTALAMLAGLRAPYETHHRVRVTDAALAEAVRLARRYFPTSALPDKAVDLLDEAAALVNVRTPRPHVRTKQELHSKLTDIQTKKERAIDEERYSDGITLADEERTVIHAIQNLADDPPRAHTPDVTVADVGAVVARITRLPEHALDERARLSHLAATMKERVLGHDYIVDHVAETLVRSASVIHDHTRPRASFLFVGPSGVGKTYFAKTLAEALYPGEDNALVRVDMGEFREAFQSSKLIGSPPGYVGYRETNGLTDAVKHRPNAIVLFDELEKAHPDILHLLLGILDDGSLTDATGTKISFRETIMLFTSNIGTRAFAADATLGFEKAVRQFSSSAVETELARMLPPEFVNRLNRVHVFTPLSRDHIARIVSMHLQSLARRLRASQVRLIVTAAAERLLAERAHVPTEGARAARRLIEETIEHPIASAMVTRDTLPDTVTVAVAKGSRRIAIEWE